MKAIWTYTLSLLLSAQFAFTAIAAQESEGIFKCSDMEHLLSELEAVKDHKKDHVKITAMNQLSAFLRAQRHISILSFANYNRYENQFQRFFAHEGLNALNDFSELRRSWQALRLERLLNDLNSNADLEGRSERLRSILNQSENLLTREIDLFAEQIEQILNFEFDQDVYDSLLEISEEIRLVQIQLEKDNKKKREAIKKTVKQQREHTNQIRRERRRRMQQDNWIRDRALHRGSDTPSLTLTGVRRLPQSIGSGRSSLQSPLPWSLKGSNIGRK